MVALEHRQNGAAEAPPRNHPYNLTQALLTARAAELVAPILEMNPTLFGQVRAYALKPETLAALLSQIDTNADGLMTVRELIDSGFVAPFADILNFGAAGEDIDALPPIDLSTLTGDAGLLFSYDTLCILSSYYSTNDGVAKGLIRWLDTAKAAEGRGDMTARAVALQGFRAQVTSQTGQALTADQAGAILAILGTL